MPPISHRADEETPLLQAAKPDSFPWLRTLALCLSRSLETFVFFSIIPWIPALIERTGISKQDLGFYVGLVEACFSATQFVFILFWGQVADRYGRKPTLLIALAGVSFCTAAFGTSTSVAQMILYRSIAGVFSACTATVRVMLGDLPNRDHITRGYAYAAVAGQLAAFASPLLSGLLYEPSARYPGLTHWLPLLERYPALLPCLLNGSVGMTAFVAVLLFVEAAPAQKMNVAEVGERLSLMKVLAIPAVRFAALLQIWGWTVDNSIAGASTTFFYTSVELGGWGWTSQRISMLLAFTGITAAIWSALMLPPVTRRYGERLIIIVAAYIMLLIPLWYIISNELLRHRLDVAFWAILPIIATVSTLALSSCLVNMQVAVNNLVPHYALGRVMSIIYALGALQRSVSPTVSNTLLAISVRNQILGGHLVWIVLAAWSAGFVGFASRKDWSRAPPLQSN